MLEQLPFTFNTALCCDCISVQKQLPHVVAVGSYELLPAASPTDDNVITKTGVGGQMRAGALDFFSIDEESLHHVNHLPCAAVFDAEWSQCSDSKLAASTADGTILLVSGTESWRDVRVVEIAVDRECMASGVSWHPHASSLCCSLTNGAIAVIDAQSPDQPLFLTRNAHAAEAWCCAWLSCDVFMTGADDCAFKLWDRRCPEKAISSVRSHDAGVTFLGRTPGAVNPNACDDVFASGSYDGSIKLWDMRALGPGTSKGGRGCIATLEIEGGGVWAIDWAPLPNGGYLGAVAAMYAGVHIVNLNCEGSGNCLQLLDSSQTLHGDGALVYGCGWLPASSNKAPSLLSCSFYNKLIGMSRWR